MGVEFYNTPEELDGLVDGSSGASLTRQATMPSGSWELTIPTDITAPVIGDVLPDASGFSRVQPRPAASVPRTPARPKVQPRRPTPPSTSVFEYAFGRRPSVPAPQTVAGMAIGHESTVPTARPRPPVVQRLSPKQQALALKARGMASDPGLLGGLERGLTAGSASAMGALGGLSELLADTVSQYTPGDFLGHRIYRTVGDWLVGKSQEEASAVADALAQLKASGGETWPGVAGRKGMEIATGLAPVLAAGAAGTPIVPLMAIQEMASARSRGVTNPAQLALQGVKGAAYGKLFGTANAVEGTVARLGTQAAIGAGQGAIDPALTEMIERPKVGAFGDPMATGSLQLGGGATLGSRPETDLARVATPGLDWSQVGESALVNVALDLLLPGGSRVAREQRLPVRAELAAQKLAKAPTEVITQALAADGITLPPDASRKQLMDAANARLQSLVSGLDWSQAGRDAQQAVGQPSGEVPFVADTVRGMSSEDIRATLMDEGVAFAPSTSRAELERLLIEQQQSSMSRGLQDPGYTDPASAVESRRALRPQTTGLVEAPVRTDAPDPGAGQPPYASPRIKLPREKKIPSAAVEPASEFGEALESVPVAGRRGPKMLPSLREPAVTGEGGEVIPLPVSNSPTFGVNKPRGLAGEGLRDVYDPASETGNRAREFERTGTQLSSNPMFDPALYKKFLSKFPFSRVQRIEEPGVASDVTKPHGLYTSPADYESPHVDLGGETNYRLINPEGNYLNVPEYYPDAAMREGTWAAGSGVHAARHFLGPERFAQLKGLGKEALAVEAAKMFPDASIDWNRYYDPQEVMEGIGGMLARQNGYDGFFVSDPTDPKWSEFVALSDKALMDTEGRPSRGTQLSANPFADPQAYRRLGEDVANFFRTRFGKGQDPAKALARARSVGVKQSSIDYTGVESFIRDNPTATGEEIARYVESREPELHPRVLRGDSGTTMRGFNPDAPGSNPRRVLMRWLDPPPGTEFRNPVHFGPETNVLYELTLEDQRTVEGDDAVLVPEAQSDWAQGNGEGGEGVTMPFKADWLGKSIEYAVADARSRGKSGVLFLKTPEQVADVQRWGGGLTERDGKYFGAGEFGAMNPDESYNFTQRDFTPIVKRYTTEIPKLARQYAKMNGVELETRTVVDADGNAQEMWYLPVGEGAKGEAAGTTTTGTTLASNPMFDPESYKRFFGRSGRGVRSNAVEEGQAQAYTERTPAIDLANYYERINSIDNRLFDADSLSAQSVNQLVTEREAVASKIHDLQSQGVRHPEYDVMSEADLSVSDEGYYGDKQQEPVEITEDEYARRERESLIEMGDEYSSYANPMFDPQAYKRFLSRKPGRGVSPGAIEEGGPVASPETVSEDYNAPITASRTPSQTEAQGVIDSSITDALAPFDEIRQQYESAKTARTDARNRLKELQTQLKTPGLTAEQRAGLVTEIKQAELDRQSTLAEANKQYKRYKPEAAKQQVEELSAQQEAENAPRRARAQSRLDDPESYRLDPNTPWIEEVLGVGVAKPFYQAALDTAVATGYVLNPDIPVTRQMLDMADRIPLAQFDEILERHGYDLPKLFADIDRTASAAGRYLNLPSQISRALNKMVARNPEMAKLKTAFEKDRLPNIRALNSLYRERSNWDRATTIYQGMLVSAVETAQKNLLTANMVVGMDTLGQLMDSAVQGTLGPRGGNKQVLSPVLAIRPLVNMYGEMFGALAGRGLIREKSNVSKLVDQLAEAFPKEAGKPLFDILNSDIETATQGNELLQQYRKQADALPDGHPRKAKLQDAIQRAEERFTRSQTLATRGFIAGEKVVHRLGWANYAQERLARRAIFEAKVRRFATEAGMDVDGLATDGKLAELPPELISRATTETLRQTFGLRPEPGSKGDYLNRILRGKLGFAVKVGALPFPNFMLNNFIRFQYEHSPLGLLSLLREGERAKVAKGDYSALWKPLLGTAVYGMFAQIRRDRYEAAGSMDIPGEESIFEKVPRKLGGWVPHSMGIRGGDKWYEVNWGGRNIDIRFTPFGPAAFLADLQERSRRGISNYTAKDVLQATTGMSTRGMEDLGGVVGETVESLRDAASADDAKRASGKYFGAIVAGLLTPLKTYVAGPAEFFSKQERIQRDTNATAEGWAGFTEAFRKQLQSRVPWWRESLPEREVPTRVAPPESQMSLAKAASGLTFIEPRNYLEQESAVLGLTPRDIVPHVGDARIDRLIDQQMGMYLEGVSENLHANADWHGLPAERRRQILIDQILPAFWPSVRKTAIAQVPDEAAKRAVMAAFTKEELAVENRRRRASGQPSLESEVKGKAREAIEAGNTGKK